MYLIEDSYPGYKKKSCTSIKDEQHNKREMKIKTTIRCRNTPTIMAKTKKMVALTAGGERSY